MKKVLVPAILVFSVLCIALLACSTGVFIGQKLTPTPVQREQSAIQIPGSTSPDTAAPGQQKTPSTTPTNTTDLFTPFWEAWNIVHNQYVDQPVDDVALMRGAIKGMMDALGDQHSSYMDPQQYKDANTSLQGEYEGIGAWVSTDGEYLTINEPMPGSPAEKAGLKPGDQITAIDGVDMTGTPPELARLKVLGPKGSKVTLTVVREGEENPLEVEVTRGRIVVPSVTGKMLDNNIAYVRIYTFGDKTGSELDKTLKELMPQKPVGLVLDLRNNGGGYLNTAVDVGSQFIADGVLLYEQYGDGTRKTFKVTGGGQATDIPMVVLTNKWTASASEIVAGALQDYGRAVLVGEKSFGKGSVQNWVPLNNEQGAIRVTIARWLTPKERQIHKIGLTPDYEVPLTTDDAKAGRDPQLDKAVELLKK
jgi:carboxyl-terminal processing protease